MGLSWYDNSNNESGFRVEQRQGDTGTFSLVATAAANTTNLGGLALPRDGNTYCFRLKAFNSGGESIPSNLACIESTEGNPTPPPPPPATPGPLSIGGISVTDTQVFVGLTWYDNSSDENGFRIERNQGTAGTYSVVATAAANTTNLGGLALHKDGNTYFFRIKLSMITVSHHLRMKFL